MILSLDILWGSFHSNSPESGKYFDMMKLSMFSRNFLTGMLVKRLPEANSRTSYEVSCGQDSNDDKLTIMRVKVSTD